MGSELRGTKILVTGPTGRVALPLTLALAKDNEVWGVARFSDRLAREQLETVGVTCISCDMATSDFAELPSDFDYVLNFAVVRGGDGDFDHDLSVNAESVGLLMAHCRSARAFLHCSSTGVYQPAGHRRLKETDPLGDHHRVHQATYSIAKIAAEVTARTGARQFGLPTTIARLNVPYGDNFGMPWRHFRLMENGEPITVHLDKPNLYNPIHEDDVIRQVPMLLEVARVPATIVNWAGDQASIEEWCAFLGLVTGLEPKFAYTEQTLWSCTTDNTRMHELIGRAEVDWHAGMQRMVDRSRLQVAERRPSP